MSWDAESHDKPLALLEFETVQEAIDRNAYKPEDDLAPHLEGNPSSELYIRRLAKAGLLKEACDFLSYALNKRVAVWWACLRVKDLKDEKVKYKDYKSPLQQKREAFPAENAAFVKEMKEAIASEKASQADMESQLKQMQDGLSSGAFKDPAHPFHKVQESVGNAPFNAEMDGLEKQVAELVANLSPEERRRYDETLAKVDEAFKAEFGAPFKEAVEQAIKEDLAIPETPDSKKMEEASQRLKDRVAAIKSAIDEQMSIFPLKIPGLPKQPTESRVDDAYQAALRWVIAPTDSNARLACAAGLAAGNCPEGILAQAAFWSGNNMAPENVKAIVPPPPGLSACGVSNVLYLCGMAQGSKLSYDERYDLHLKAGLEVAEGTNLWDQEFAKQFTPANWELKKAFARTSALNSAPTLAPEEPKPAREVLGRKEKEPVRLAPLPDEEPAAPKRNMPGRGTLSHISRPEIHLSASQAAEANQHAAKPRPHEPSDELAKRNLPGHGSIGPVIRRGSLKLPDDETPKNS